MPRPALRGCGRPCLWKPKLLIGLFYMHFCFWGMTTIAMVDKGMTALQIGAIGTASGWIGWGAQALWTVSNDVARRPQALVAACACLAAVAALAFVAAGTPLQIGAAVVAYGCFIPPGPLVDGVVLKYLPDKRDYGKQRFWGPAVIAVTAVLIGVLWPDGDWQRVAAAGEVLRCPAAAACARSPGAAACQGHCQGLPGGCNAVTYNPRTGGCCPQLCLPLASAPDPDLQSYASTAPAYVLEAEGAACGAAYWTGASPDCAARCTREPRCGFYVAGPGARCRLATPAQCGGRWRAEPGANISGKVSAGAGPRFARVAVPRGLRNAAAAGRPFGPGPALCAAADRGTAAGGAMCGYGPGDGATGPAAAAPARTATTKTAAIATDGAATDTAMSSGPETPTITVLGSAGPAPAPARPDRALPEPPPRPSGPDPVRPDSPVAHAPDQPPAEPHDGRGGPTGDADPRFVGVLLEAVTELRYVALRTAAAGDPPAAWVTLWYTAAPIARPPNATWADRVAWQYYGRVPTPGAAAVAVRLVPPVRATAVHLVPSRAARRVTGLGLYAGGGEGAGGAAALPAAPPRRRPPVGYMQFVTAGILLLIALQMATVDMRPAPAGPPPALGPALAAAALAVGSPRSGTPFRAERRSSVEGVPRASRAPPGPSLPPSAAPAPPDGALREPPRRPLAPAGPDGRAAHAPDPPPPADGRGRAAAPAAPPPAPAPPLWPVVKLLLRRGRFLAFLALCACVGTGHLVLDAFLGIHLRRLRSTVLTLELADATGTASELLFFGVSKWMLQRLGPSLMLRLSLGCYVLKATLYASTTAALWRVVLARSLHSACFAVTWTALQHHLALSVPQSALSTAVLLLFTAFFNVPGLFVGVVGGLVVDDERLGSAALFYGTACWFGAVLCGVCALQCCGCGVLSPPPGACDPARPDTGQDAPDAVAVVPAKAADDPGVDPGRAASAMKVKLLGGGAPPATTAGGRAAEAGVDGSSDDEPPRQAKAVGRKAAGDDQKRKLLNDADACDGGFAPASPSVVADTLPPQRTDGLDGEREASEEET